jgi:bifunctional DNA-binding transcriptional regulator/antitoxin component of YhaV-PrlF toxin-antitoxin module
MTRRTRKPDMKAIAALDAEIEEHERKTALVIGASYEVRVDNEFKISPPNEVLGYLRLRPGDRVVLTLTPEGVLMSSENFIRPDELSPKSVETLQTGRDEREDKLLRLPRESRDLEKLLKAPSGRNLGRDVTKALLDEREESL